MMEQICINKSILLALKIDETYEIKKLYPYFKLLTPKKKGQIKKYYFKKDKLRCFYGQLLLHYGLNKLVGINIDKLEYIYNEYGKPFIKKIGYNIFFNLSHSGDWVVCAFSNDDVGVDVEVIKMIDYKIVDSYFSKEEICEFYTLSEEEKKERFFEYWTLKESFIKNIGKGLHYKLNKFSVILENEIYVKINREKSPDYFFRQYHLDDKHKLAICIRNNHFPKQVTFVKHEELLDYFCL